jgi:hypothetical protein
MFLGRTSRTYTSGPFVTLIGISQGGNNPYARAK